MADTLQQYGMQVIMQQVILTGLNADLHPNKIMLLGYGIGKVPFRQENVCSNNTSD